METLKNIFIYLEKNICVFYIMPARKNYKRKTQKKNKGGRLWCETMPFNYIRPCKSEEIIIERNREAKELEIQELKKENEMKIKEKESEMAALKKQKEEEISALKSGTSTSAKLWGGKRRNKSKKKNKRRTGKK